MDGFMDNNNDNDAGIEGRSSRQYEKVVGSRTNIILSPVSEANPFPRVCGNLTSSH